jgi:rfaE bifunctional protein nucleotidyltransferase chain/domain
MSDVSPKLVAFDAAQATFETLRAQGKNIVQSHGIFDLIHPGHVCHLEEARTLGDVLVVTITADKQVQKGPGRPYFNQQLRSKSLAALSCVDFVVVVPFSGAVEAIAVVRPTIYCKGKEYEDPDFDTEGVLKDEVAAVSRIGGEVRYIGSIKYSSTKLLNQYFDHLSIPVKSFCNALASRCTRRDFVEAVESFADLNVLVIGDTIFDRYSAVKVQGLTSKARILSGRFLKQQTHCGGALAVFRHVKQFTANVKFLSIVGTESWVEPILAAHLRPDEDLVIRDQAFTTIVKERFIEPRADGGELSKLFSVNYLDAEPPSAKALQQIEGKIRAAITKADAVLLLDFGHGMMQSRIRDIVQELSPFLALNCQTNSNNHGFNIINRQYKRADVFTLDEQEMMLAAARRHLDFEQELLKLKQNLCSNYAWLTRGAVQTIGMANDEKACLCPPLETDIVDAVGAGDAFFSIAALAAAKKLPVELSTFLGQLAGAQAVKIVGNERPISKQVLIKAGMSLLNF